MSSFAESGLCFVNIRKWGGGGGGEKCYGGVMIFGNLFCVGFRFGVFEPFQL